VDLLWETPSVMSRFDGTGVVSRQDAVRLGLVGPAARASGVDQDVRSDLPWGIYQSQLLPSISFPTGDVAARAYVRWFEIQKSVVFDLGRFGIQFVASPRHADGLLITGPVPKNMELALCKTYEATPAPRIVIAVGACAISGGLFANHPEANKGADGIVPVDLYVPGCPPHPITILDGLLRLLGTIK